MKKILFAAFALCTVAFGACSKDDGGKGDPAGSALLNMMNESNGRTLLGSSDVYVDDAGNFVCSSAVIAYVGRVNGLNGVPIRFDNLVRKTAVDVGGGYLVYDGESLHEFPSGHIALAAGATFYRMRVESEIMGEDAVTGKTGMTGAKVVYYADKAGNAGILPEPFVSKVLSKNESYKRVLDLTEEWGKVSSAKLAQGCLVARADYIEQNPEIIKEFMSFYEASVNFVNNENNAGAVFLAKNGYFDTPQLAADTIPNCNIVFITGEEMKKTATENFTVLFEANPASVGGEIPADALYYLG